MTTTKSLHIGFVIPLQRVSFWTIFGQAAKEAAERQGMTVSTSFLRDLTLADELVALNQLITRQVDVLFIPPIDPQDPSLIAALRTANAAGIKVITLDTQVGGGLEVCTILSDDRAGMAAAT